MKKIILIIPYFGKKPEYYELWAMCAKNNATIDFLILTDISSIKSDGNIHVKHMLFNEMRDIIQQKFDFNIVLDKPYKLCDYKPVLGYVLENEIAGYDFWGHCDLDLVFGDIRKFLTDDILDTYDKVFEHGHFCLYRNNEKFRKLFLEDGEYPEINYKEAFTTTDSYAFDEFPGMLYKCRRLKIQIYSNTRAFFDAKVNSWLFKDAFCPNNSIYSVIKCCDKKLFAVEYNKDKTSTFDREIMYFHFQKRKLCNWDKSENFEDGFYIIPNEVVSLDYDTEKIFSTDEHNEYQKKIDKEKKKKKIHDHVKRFIQQIKTREVTGIISYIRKRKMINKKFLDNKRMIKTF